MGSYAKLKLKGFSSNNHHNTTTNSLNIEPKFDLSFQDIYVPDGQIKGHVQPPQPIQQAFNQGWYRLRDANWEPDFPTSAKTIRWFLEKGNEINPQLLITINLSTIQKILPHLKTNNPILNAQQISLLLQNNIQQNFFPGSTYKKDLLASIGKDFFTALSNAPINKKIKIISIIFQELKAGEILINAQNPKLQAFLEKKDYAGKLQPTACKRCLSDTIAIIESNLGSNKANQFITRQTTHTINKTNSSINHHITILYNNTSPTKLPQTPNHHGGDYLNYIRFYIPQSANNIHISTRPQKNNKPPTINNKFNFKEIGLFHLIPHLTKTSITISYQLPINNPIHKYQLTILKQSGINQSPQTIHLFNKTQTLNLSKDLHLQSTF